MAVRAVPFDVGSTPWSELRGSILILDFFTYGCINCMNNALTMQKLHEAYGERVRVVGVHSPKFEREKEQVALQQALERLGITYVVVEDGDHTLMNAYAVKAWPTTVIIDAQGYIVETFSGECRVEAFVPFLGSPEASKTAHEIPANRLRFPQKLLCSDTFLAIANSGAGSVLLCDYEGHLLRELEGFVQPMGMALKGRHLYVADSGSGEVVRVDLDADQREVVLQGLRNPYDLTMVDDLLVVAEAGAHCITAYDVASMVRVAVWGNRFEALRDGAYDAAQLAQPSGLSLLHERLWFVDAESSSLRYIEQGDVVTVIGEGLNTFGDCDEAPLLLQHPQDVVCGQYGDGCGGGRIFIADTYNGKVKVYNPDDDTMMTLISKLQEPSGIAKRGCKLYITDTNTHRIVVFDLSEMRLIPFNMM